MSRNSGGSPSIIQALTGLIIGKTINITYTIGAASVNNYTLRMGGVTIVSNASAVAGNYTTPYTPISDTETIEFISSSGLSSVLELDDISVPGTIAIPIEPQTVLLVDCLLLAGNKLSWNSGDTIGWNSGDTIGVNN